MDSGNSESFQSSSGGGGPDDEYNSCLADQPLNAGVFAAGGGELPPLGPLHHHSSPLGYDTLSFLDPDLFAFDPSPAWISGTAAAPSTSPANQLCRPPAAPPATTFTAAAPARSSKKRTRASRRAPTTVLTTDTTNFRAMVQEFTGIPTTPFSAHPSTYPPFTRARLDIFAGGSPAPPSFLLRPFAQKALQAPPPLLTTTTTTTTTSTTSGAGVPANYGAELLMLHQDHEGRRHHHHHRLAGGGIDTLLPNFQSNSHHQLAGGVNNLHGVTAAATSSVPAASYGGGVLTSRQEAAAAPEMVSKVAAESGVAPARGDKEGIANESWICSSD